MMVAVRGLVLFGILKYTATDFDVTEMATIVLYLGGTAGLVGGEAVLKHFKEKSK